MSAFRVIGGNIISEAEYRSKTEELLKFTKKPAGEVTLSWNRALTADALKKAKSDFLTKFAEPPAEAEIGKGKPCSILIREVYPGEFPAKGLFGKLSDLAVVSGVKSYEITNATARALNFIEKQHEPLTPLYRPDPFTNGTSLVAYSPAVTTDSWTLGFEFGAASFPTEFMNLIGGAFASAAQIPLFLPYSGYLFGASQLVKLASKIGHALTDGVVYKTATSIDFDVYGVDPAVAGFRIISEADFSGACYTYSPKTGVVGRDGKPYRGATPYIVISLDGKQKDHLKSFAPLAASAEILQRFFDVPEGGQVAVESLVQGLKVLSDLKYRQQAVDLGKQLTNPNLDQATKDRLKREQEAALKNILTEELKPTSK